MGRFSRFLRVCAILSISFFTVNAFGAGYTCPTLKKYTSCEPGYYLSGTGAGNSCKQCEQGYYCTGGTNARTLCTAGKACTTTGLSAPNATCTAGYYCPAGSASATQSKCPTNWTSAGGAGAQTQCYRNVNLYKTANGITATGVLFMTNPVTSTTVSSTGTTALTTQCYYNTACTFPTVTQASSSSTTTRNALYHPYVNFTGGWVTSSTNVSGGTTKTFNITSTASSVSYYPAHTSKAVTITLSSSNATSSGTTAIYSKYGSGTYLDSALANKMSGTENPITVPTRAGYVFKGYYTAASGGTLIIKPTGYYADASTTRFTQPTTLYAQWDPCAAGYYCPAGSTSTTAYDCDTGTTTSSSNNYWLSNPGASARTQCYRTVTLNAYGAYEATLTWTDGCGNSKTWTPSSSANTTSQCCKYGTACPMPSPTGLTPASGYKIFDGWYTTYTLPNSGVSLTNSPSITSTSATVTYYPARRKINTLTLNNQSANTAGTTAIYSVYSDGVYLDSSLTKKMTVSSSTLGDNPITLPTKTGYTFGGYYTLEACSGAQRIDADGRIKSTFHNGYTADATFYACWVANPYPVTFDANGGSGHSPTSVTATYGQPMPELTRLPTRAGYVFDGWWYNGNMYYDASGNSFLNWNVDAGVTLTARWKECTAGYYCPAGSTSVTQNQCPTNWTSDAATSSENACYRTCAPGTLWNPDTGACESSPQGYICSTAKKVTYGSRTTMTLASQLQSCGLCRNVRGYPYVLSDVGNTSAGGCYAGFIVNKNGGTGVIAVRDMYLNTSTTYTGTDNGVLKCYSQANCVMPSQDLTQTGYTFPNKWCFTENCDWGPVIDDGAQMTTSALMNYVAAYNNQFFTSYPQRVIGLDGTIGNESNVTIGYVGELFAGKKSKCNAGTYLPARSTTCVTCPAGSYCEGGEFPYSTVDQGKSTCPDPNTYKRATQFSSSNGPTVELDTLILSSTAYDSQTGLTKKESCKVLSWYDAKPAEDGGIASLYEYATYNTSTNTYSNTIAWGYQSVRPGYYLNTPSSCGAFAYYHGVAKCPAGSYCPGKNRVACNSSNQATVHTETFGLNTCPVGYANSNEGATANTQCYTYVALDKNSFTFTIGDDDPTGCDLVGQSDSAAILGVYYNTECTLPGFNGTQTGYTDSTKWATSRNLGEGDAVTKIGGTTSALSQTAYFAQKTSCAANYYKKDATTCDTCANGTRYYTLSPAGNLGDTSVCYLTTTAGKSVETSGADQVTCPAGSYCVGGIAVNYGSTGGRAQCPTGRFCPAGSSAATTCPGLYVNSNAGSDEAEDCYFETTGGKYLANATDTAQTTCEAKYYCPATTLYYPNVGGRNSCPDPTSSTYKETLAEMDWLTERCPTATTSNSSLQSSKYQTWDNITGLSKPEQCLAGMYVVTPCANFTIDSAKYNSTTGHYDSDSDTASVYTSYVKPGYYLHTIVSSTYCNNPSNMMLYRYAVQCPAGSYCPGGNVPSCSSGTYNNTWGANECTTGSYSGVGAAGCTACGVGTTTSGPGQSSCNATCSNASGVYSWYLSVGWNTDNTVSHVCEVNTCDANMYHNSETGDGYIGKCLPCGANSYNPSNEKNLTCACDSGHTANASVSGAVVVENGQACQLITDIQCRAGEYLPAKTTTCAACSKGYFCRSGGTYSFSDSIQGREACQPGQYQPNTGKTSCLKAGKGYYVNGSAKTAQVACSGATYQDETGQASCKNCPTGYTANTTSAKQAQTACQISCPKGTQVATPNAQCTTPSGNWYTTAAQLVNYGQTSTVNMCNVATNLFDPSDYDSLWGYISSSSTTVTAYDQNAIVWVPVEPNTTYIVSGMRGAATMTMANSASVPVVGGKYSNYVDPGSVGKGVLYTTSSDAKYLILMGLRLADNSTTSTRQSILDKNVANLQIFKANDGYGIIGNATTAHDASTDCKITCAPGQYVATPGDACVDVGAGYYAPGGTVTQGSDSSRSQCPTNLTTIGYGTGANEADDCGRKLHAGDNVVYLRSAQRTTPSLRVRVGDDVFFGSLSETIEGALKVDKDGTEYSVVNDWQ